MNWISLFQNKQLPLIAKEKALDDKDFKKIMKNLPNKDIFGTSCSEWVGCVCNRNKEGKGLYINYYHSKKKKSLHRLLYENFINSELRDKSYLIHSCGNKLCCNVNHLVIKKDKDVPKKEEMYKIQLTISFD